MIVTIMPTAAILKMMLISIYAKRTAISTPYHQKDFYIQRAVFFVVGKTFFLMFLYVCLALVQVVYLRRGVGRTEVTAITTDKFSVRPFKNLFAFERVGHVPEFFLRAVSYPRARI